MDQGQGFSAYLAKYYIGRKGFKAGAVPEAEALTSACDAVLTRVDGMSLQIICLVDRESNPGKAFALSREALDAIGQQCLKYTGRVNGAKMPVTIQVMEVGAGPGSEQDRRRLGALKRKSIRSKVILNAWILDTAAGTAWTNSLVGGLFARRSLERLLRSPRMAEADLAAPEARVAPPRLPLVTIGLLLALAAVFACEIAFGVGAWKGFLEPSLATLVAFGGLNRTLVLHGEWHRLFSSAFLHANLLHLLINGLCLYLAGRLLESLVGRLWFLALFVIGTVGGALMSLALNPATLVSVGASGAIMGLLAAAFVLSFRYPSGPARLRIQMTALQILIPSLLPLAVVPGGGHVDIASHLGGTLSGLVAGFVMLRTWRLTDLRPAFVPLATALCAAGALAVAASLPPVLRDYHTYMLDTLLIPAKELPRSKEEITARSADLVSRYPHDPRARLFQAIALIDGHDLPGAERELRAGLAEKEILETKFRPILRGRMQGMLALVLSDGNHPLEAKAAAQSVCGLDAATLGNIWPLLRRAKLCEQ